MTLQGRPPAGLVLVSGYTSIPDAAMAYPIIPILYPLQGFSFARKFFRNISSEKWENDITLELGVKCPVLIVHGTSDFEIPVHHARTLFLKAMVGLSKQQNVRSPENLTMPPASWEKKGVYSGDHYTVNRVKNEADMWASKHIRDRVFLLEITRAGHNNIHAFEIFQSVLADFSRKQL
ncbi:MAG: hypothetical protein SGCHY_001499 [Lobulomycetales sp.]